MEKRIQKFREDNKTFDQLAARNRLVRRSPKGEGRSLGIGGGSAKKFRFIDGPITANNPICLSFPRLGEKVQAGFSRSPC